MNRNRKKKYTCLDCIYCKERPFFLDGYDSEDVPNRLKTYKCKFYNKFTYYKAQIPCQRLWTHNQNANKRNVNLKKKLHVLGKR